MNKLKELYKYIAYLVNTRSGSCDITIVRRYTTPSGFNGELYVDGKYIGMSCDNLTPGVEMTRYPVRVSYRDGKRVITDGIYQIRNGEFTELLPPFTASVGSLDPRENRLILAQLCDAVQSKSLIKLSILNRLLTEIK